MTPQIYKLWCVFSIERERFAGFYPQISRAILVVHIGKLRPDSKLRDLGYAIVEDLQIHLSSLLADMSLANIIGIIRHELGHLCDTNPYIPNTGQEQLADDIAEFVSGQRIYYDKNDIQTIIPAKYPRPQYLHR